MAFHPYPRIIRKLFNAWRFGPPPRLTGASACPWVDHRVSRLPPPTRRPVRTRFRSGCGTECLTLAGGEQLVGSLCKRHAVIRQMADSDRLRAHGFRFYFTPLSTVLFTFPSRYLFTIGLPGVFSLAGWCRRIQPGIHRPRPTQVPSGKRPAPRTGPSPTAVRLPMRFRRADRMPGAEPYNPRRAATRRVWANPVSLAATHGITLVFSSSGYLDVSVPRVRLPASRPGSPTWSGGLPHSDTRGSTRLCRSPRIFAA